MHNIQQMLADAQSKADTNGDGKLTIDDAKALAAKHGLDDKFVDDLKKRGDTNGDGKVDIEDLKANIDVIQRGARDTFENAKDKLFGGGNHGK